MYIVYRSSLFIDLHDLQIYIVYRFALFLQMCIVYRCALFTDLHCLQIYIADSTPILELSFISYLKESSSAEVE